MKRLIEREFAWAKIRLILLKHVSGTCHRIFSTHLTTTATATIAVVAACYASTKALVLPLVVYILTTINHIHQLRHFITLENG